MYRAIYFIYLHSAFTALCSSASRRQELRLRRALILYIYRLSCRFPQATLKHRLHHLMAPRLWPRHQYAEVRVGVATYRQEMMTFTAADIVTLE